MKLQSKLALLALLSGSMPVAIGQTYERLDVSTTGALGNALPTKVVMSDDGRIAAFASKASNLVLPDNANSVDLFVRDRLNSTTVRVANDVVLYNQAEDNLEITPDGRWIVFATWRLNHFETDVYDRQLGTTTQAAPSLADALPTGITPDGRYVAILGRMATGTTPYDAWRFDMQTGALVLASHDAQGAPAGAFLTASRGTLSADGDSMVFTSRSPNLVPNDTNNTFDLFLFHASTGSIEQVSVDDAGVGGSGAALEGSISADGTKVALLSTETNLVPFPVNAVGVYLRDRTLGTTTLVTLTTGGAQMSASWARITDDGRQVAFTSGTPNVIPGDGGIGWDVFVRDTTAGITRAVTTGAPNAVVDFQLGTITGGGRWVTFISGNPGMPNYTYPGGAYVADMGPACSTASYCAALPNSTGVAASIGAQGEPSLHSGAFTLTAANLPPNAIAIFASGTSAIDPGVPFGNGLRCIGGSLVRHGVVHASAGSVSAPQDFASPVYAATRPGDVLHFQCVYRDPSAGGAAFNTTDALSVTFCY